MIVTCYVIVVMRAIEEMMKHHEPVLAHITAIFFASGLISFLFLGLLLPAWLVYVFVDL